MRPDYRDWLTAQKYDPGTVAAQLYRVERVEKVYGNLDDRYRDGTLQNVIDELIYSSSDERSGRPNPSKIQFEGNIRNNLASYRNAVARYRTFLEGWEIGTIEPPTVASSAEIVIVEEKDEFPRQRLSLERDMQMALRRNIHQLGSELTIADDGAERSVHSGFIDITCEDGKDGALVVVELKAGVADSRAIGQILGYMGDLSDEEDGRTIRGILVAHEFDKRTQSAARVVPSLELFRYAVDFRFERIG